MERAEVTENAGGGTFVAHVTVLDADQRAAGRVNCSLGTHDDRNDTNYFRLNQFDETEYQLVTADDVIIDREQRDDFLLSVMCVDYGQPALTARRQVRACVRLVFRSRPRRTHSRLLARPDFACVWEACASVPQTSNPAVHIGNRPSYVLVLSVTRMWLRGRGLFSNYFVISC